MLGSVAATQRFLPVRGNARVRFKESSWSTPNFDAYSNPNRKREENRFRNREYSNRRFPYDYDEDYGQDYDEYDDDFSEDDDEEDVDDVEIDFKAVLGLFGIGLPVAFVAVPWLINHPMSLTMVLALPPLIQRAYRFAVEVMTSFSTSRSRFRARYRSRFATTANRHYQRSRSSRRRSRSSRDDDEMDQRDRDEDDDMERYREMDQGFRSRNREMDRGYGGRRYRTGECSEDDEIRESGSWEIPNARNEEQGAMDGWIELERDRELMRRRTRIRSKLRMKRLRRKDLSLFWRLLLSAFPFLRSWGGFL